MAPGEKTYYLLDNYTDDNVNGVGVGGGGAGWVVGGEGGGKRSVRLSPLVGNRTQKSLLHSSRDAGGKPLCFQDTVQKPLLHLLKGLEAKAGK